MSFQTREFTKTVQVNLDNLLDMQYAQLQTKKRFLDQLSDSGFSNVLASVTGILSLVFAAYTPVSVATAIGSLILSMGPNDKQLAADSADRGYIGLGEPIQFMRDPQYNLIEIELPYREYSEWGTSETTQFITGEGIINRVHTGSGWITF